MLTAVATQPTKSLTVADVLGEEDLKDEWYGETIRPEMVPPPERFQLVVRQIGIREKKGSIILVNKTVDDMKWTQGIGVVLALGPAVYRGNKFKDMGLHPTDAPQVGDLVMFEARAPRRAEVNDTEVLYIPDDAVYGRPLREHLSYLSFNK